jgi:hypothetical protein
MLKYSGPRQLKSLMEIYVLQRIRDKISRNEIRLILNWNSIVGNEIAQYTKPQKISYAQNANVGVLHLIVTNGSKALEIQHMVSFIIEKITVFYGYKAVYNIRIKQS